MNINIQFQLCGLLILILLIIFYKSHRTLQLYKEKVFYIAMCIITISLVMDILSLIFIYYRASLPGFLVDMVCKSYIITLIWGACIALIYVISDLLSVQRHKKITVRIVLLLAVQSLIIFLLPIYIFDDGNAVYTYGPAVLGVYAFVAAYVIATVTVANVYRHRLNPRRRSAILLWMIIWTIAALIQFINSSLLIVGFASALGMLILFVIMENPEANLERNLGCFNSYALSEYINQLYDRNADFSILEISLENTSFIKEEDFDSNDMLKKLLVMGNNDVLVFKNINLSLVLISHMPEKLEAVATSVIAAFSNLEGLNKTTTLILTSNTSSFSNMDELFHFLQYIQLKYKDNKGTLIYANEEMISEYKSKYLIEQQITEALAEDRVEVFMQPIYSIQEKAFTSAEALVRIRKKDGELLSPGVFIPVAEENGQILELGERVFEKVCQFLKSTDTARFGVKYIEINLSVVQCEKTDLFERLMSIIEKNEVDPKMINLEITETATIEAQKILLMNMSRLIKAGFTFSLDDFGKGESNLMYVVQMPVSIIKIDYDLSKSFFKSLRAKHVVRAIISMAHDMNLKVVAEGIETEEEAAGMQQEGVDYIQGFYYSKPLPLPEYIKFIDEQFMH